MYICTYSFLLDDFDPDLRHEAAAIITSITDCFYRKIHLTVVVLDIHFFNSTYISLDLVLYIHWIDKQNLIIAKAKNVLTVPS